MFSQTTHFWFTQVTTCITQWGMLVTSINKLQVCISLSMMLGFFLAKRPFGKGFQLAALSQPASQRDRRGIAAKAGPNHYHHLAMFLAAPCSSFCKRPYLGAF